MLPRSAVGELIHTSFPAMSRCQVVCKLQTVRANSVVSNTHFTGLQSSGLLYSLMVCVHRVLVNLAGRFSCLPEVCHAHSYNAIRDLSLQPAELDLTYTSTGCEAIGRAQILELHSNIEIVIILPLIINSSCRCKAIECS